MNVTNLAKDYNSAIAVVDVVVYNREQNKILLGKKKHESGWRFIGGFVDWLQDNSYEEAARRELQEEAPNIEPIFPMRYVGSLQVNDGRYNNDKDKIFTAFYICDYMYGNTKAGDDIDELDWFLISTLTEEEFVESHRPLFRMLIETQKFYGVLRLV